MDSADELKARLIERALGEGFARVGVARVEPLGEEAEHLERWLAAGHHGTMTWMKETASLRLEPSRPEILDGARSIVVLAAPYARAPAAVGPTPGLVARYARGRDYHNVLRRPLGRLARWLREQGHGARATVDSAPVYERAWAARAGVGFIGKNCALIVPGLGSHLFLATLLTTAELEPDEPIATRCGSCRACLDACPTDAFVGPRELDARRCVSYLTIEHRGAIEPSLMSAIGAWFLGCDGCQDVCPYNRRLHQGAFSTESYAPADRWTRWDAADWLTMSEEQTLERTEGSPARRLGRERLARNAAIVLGNAGSKAHLPILREIAQSDASGVVREACAWALDELSRRHPA